MEKNTLKTTKYRKRVEFLSKAPHSFMTTATNVHSINHDLVLTALYNTKLKSQCQVPKFRGQKS